MKYIGSKNRISKELAPIIQSYITDGTVGYLEPFVGGANMIDKINCKKKIGCDIHKELIALLKYTQENELPEAVSEEEYVKVKNNKSAYEPWYIGLVGFCASFGAKYFGGYARGVKSDGVTPRNMSGEAIRNLKKQACNLKKIEFINCSFLDIPKEEIKNHVIYCDIPYRGTTRYKTEQFPYDEFYKWVKELSRDNTVLISEYDMPSEFTCIWEKEVKVNLDSERGESNASAKRTEKLFIYKDI